LDSVRSRVRAPARPPRLEQTVSTGWTRVPVVLEENMCFRLYRHERR